MIKKASYMVSMKDKYTKPIHKVLVNYIMVRARYKKHGYLLVFFNLKIQITSGQSIHKMVWESLLGMVK